MNQPRLCIKHTADLHTMLPGEGVKRICVHNTKYCHLKKPANMYMLPPILSLESMSRLAAALELAAASLLTPCAYQKLYNYIYLLVIPADMALTSDVKAG